jgi:hypothetical protein
VYGLTVGALFVNHAAMATDSAGDGEIYGDMLDSDGQSWNCQTVIDDRN